MVMEEIPVKGFLSPNLWKYLELDQILQSGLNILYWISIVPQSTAKSTW